MFTGSRENFGELPTSKVFELNKFSSGGGSGGGGGDGSGAVRLPASTNTAAAAASAGGDAVLTAGWPERRIIHFIERAPPPATRRPTDVGRRTARVPIRGVPPQQYSGAFRARTSHCSRAFSRFAAAAAAAMPAAGFQDLEQPVARKTEYGVLESE